MYICVLCMFMGVGGLESGEVGWRRNGEVVEDEKTEGEKKEDAVCVCSFQFYGERVEIPCIHVHKVEKTSRRSF